MIKKVKKLLDKTIFYKNYRELHKNVDPEELMGRNIYEAKKVGDYVRKHDFVHGIIKYTFIIPGVKFLTWLGRKHIEKRIPEKYEYRFLNAFQKAVDDGLVVWLDQYLYGAEKGKSPSKYIKRCLGGVAATTIKNGTNILLTGAKSDSAYLVLFDIIMQQLKTQLNMISSEGYVSYHNKNHINSPSYFIANTFRNETIITERVRQTRHWYDKEGKLFIKDIGGWKQVVRQISDELGTTPNNLRNELYGLIKENNLLWNALLKLNNESADVLTRTPKKKINLELKNDKTKT